MNRRTTVLLTALLLVGILAAPVQAQPGGPPPTVHIVQRGETLFAIAQQYGTTVDAITHANGISDPRQIYVGQRLVIPGGAGEDGVQETEPYVVQTGDTLASIARRYQTTWQTLVHVNGLLSPNTIYAGQVIQVPSPPSSPPLGGKEGGRGLVYIVRSDDTPLRIALRYNVSPWALAAFSHVANPALIYPGQQLAIPGEGPGSLPAPFASVKVQPLPINQGMAMIIWVGATEPVTLEGRLFEQEVRFAEEGGAYYGLVGVGAFREPGLYELELTAVDGGGQSTAITTAIVVEAARFGYERIDLPEGRTHLLDPALIAAERERLDAIRYTFTSERRWEGAFQRPCAGTISAYFGAHRAYASGPYTSYHSGVDFRAPTGTPVYAPAAGTVVMAESLTVRGDVIFLDHGWGLLTGYWHLSAMEVQVGQQVAPGDLIGRVGNTGLSTGAHLHWETWVGGVSVDGLQWLEESYPWLEPGWLAVGG
ncbi:MAG: LysM peptidoglycan-binding domain-containing protein [Chloroflexi bacterium]|nr:LysM peptidoglycan-binding domain-containing protein [Chloroflexota bacterium]